MKKYLDKIILYAWPLIFSITLVVFFMGSVIFWWAASWAALGAAGYDYGDHPTESSGIGFAVFFMGGLFASIILGILFVTLISLFKYLAHTDRGYWNCFKEVYAACVRLAWIIILPLMIIDVILVFTIG